MRRWHDGYGDCDVTPGSPECLCCFKLWQEGYCQFIPVDLDSIKQTTLKTLNRHECNQCENNPLSNLYQNWHKENPKFAEANLFKCGFKVEEEKTKPC